MRTLTVILSEISSPLPPCSPEPLIYTVYVADNPTDDSILKACAEQRRDDLDSSLDIDEVANGLQLHFCFGGVTTFRDWRN